jgi:hypothetical protein
VLHRADIDSHGLISGGVVAAAVDGWLDAGATVLFVAAGSLMIVPLWRRRRAQRAGTCGAGCSCRRVASGT